MTETAQKEPLKEEKQIVLTNSLVTREELDKFKQIAKKDYGVELTDEQAFEQSTALLNFFDHFIDKRVEEKRKGANINNTRPG